MGGRRLGFLVVLLALVAGGLWLWSRRSPDRAATDASPGTAVGLRAASSPPAARLPAAMGGQVRGPGGLALAGAVVTVSADDDPLRHREVRTAVTNAAGVWAIVGLEPGVWQVGAAAPGHAPATLDAPILLTDGQTRDDLVLELRAGDSVVTGQVTDAGGGDVAGARLSARRTDTHEGLASTRCGADGRYSLSLAPGRWTVQAEHEAYAPEERTIEVGPGGRIVDFALIPGGSVQGRVVDRHGAPVPGLVVLATLDDRPVAAARNGEDGRFVLRGLAAGALSLSASGPRHATPGAVALDLGIAEQVQGVEIVVDGAFTISGVVVDGQGQPVGGVVVGGASRGLVSIVRAASPTAGDGRFELQGALPGRWSLDASGESVLPLFDGPEVTVDGADVVGIEVRVDRGVTLRGRVEPAQQATVVLDTPAGGSRELETVLTLQGTRTRTAADGAFTILAAPSGSLRLVATGDDGATGELPIELATRSIDGLVVPLVPRPALHGTLVDDGGAPVEGARVLVSPRGEPWRAARSAPSGADGRFTVTGLARGPHEVEVRDDRGRLAIAAARPALPLTITSVPVQTMQLIVDRGAGEIRGVVLDAAGHPAKDVWVHAVRGELRAIESAVAPGGQVMRAVEPVDPDEHRTHGEGRLRPVLTGDDGSFVMAGALPGPYTLVASDPLTGARARQAKVSAGAAVRLTLTPLGSVTATVTLAGTEPPDCTIMAEGPTWSRARLALGKATIARLAPGAYKISTQCKEGTAQTTVEVAAGDRVQVDLELAAYARVTGRVIDVDGRPVAGVQVQLREEGQDRGVTTVHARRSGADGRFTIEGVPAMTLPFSVTAGPDDHFLGHERVITLQPGATVDLGDVPVLNLPPPPATRLALHFDPAGLEASPQALRIVTGLAGLQAGDVIVAVDGFAVDRHGARPVMHYLERSPRGVSRRIDVLRGGAALTIETVLVPD
jgi:hypothetical protein